MRYYLSLFFLVVFVLITNNVTAQKRALAKPKVFERPIMTESYYLSSTKETTKTPWIVVCDRDDAQTFEQIGSDNRLERLKTQLKFKEWFYVSEEQGSFIRIFKGKVNAATLKIEEDFEDYGWISKKNMLLWTTAALDATTKIEIKAFCKTNIKNIQKQSVTTYEGPDTRKTLKNINIYDFYFIVKEEEGKFLLSRNSHINPQKNVDDLVGWIRYSYLETWNNRLCIEPNFQEKAFLERKNNPNFQFAAYANKKNALKHSETGQCDNTQVIWQNDPVKLMTSDLASDGRRFKGAALRFPLLSYQKEDNYLKSSIIGHFVLEDTNTKQIPKLDETDIQTIKQLQTQKAKAKKNFDVLFVIEGTKSMTWYKETIEKTIKNVSEQLATVSNVRYGAAIYRDTPEKANNKLFSIEKMTNSITTITDFVAQSEFDRWQDDSDLYTAMNYGIHQAVLETEMTAQNTNIIFVIGSNGDLQANPSRQTDECFFKTEVLAAQLANLNAHIIGLQCKSRGKEGVDFVKNLSNLILQTAQIDYKPYENISKNTNTSFFKPPSLTKEFQLVSSINTGQIITSPENSSLKEDEVINKARTATKKVLEFTKNFGQNIKKLSSNNNEVFSPNAAQLLFNIVEEGEKKSISQADLEEIVQNKYKFYTEVFIPKKIKGANYNLYSLVLFLPENELEDYIDVLDQLAIDLMKSNDDLRQGLSRALIKWSKQYANQQKLPDTYSTKDLKAAMIGISKETLPSDNEKEIIIEDILNEKKVSNEDIQILSNRMISKSKTLKRISTQGKKYEFSYANQNGTYFWIPLKDVF